VDYVIGLGDDVNGLVDDRNCVLVNLG